MHVPRTIAAAFVALLTAIASLTPAVGQQRAPTAAPEIRVSDNLIVVPDANARSVTGWLIVKAGCADEADGNCIGIAHYLEHLLFINRDNEHRSKVAFFPDGSGNGWTSHRATTYFQRFPATPGANDEKLDKLIAYFAGLLAEVRVDEAQAARERNVVLQEYQQNTGRNPFARFAVELNLALMPNEPLGQRVIGSPKTIGLFTADAARDFHRRWYRRSNAVVVLHGPIDPAVAGRLVARHFAALPPGKVPANVWKTSRKYAGEKLVVRKRDKDARQTGVSLDKIVTFASRPRDDARLQAAQAVLGSFLSSRLQGSPLENLMERDGVVTQGRLGLSRVRQGAIRVSFSGVPADGVAPEKVIEAARAYLAQLASTGLDKATVERLKLRITNERNLLAQQPALYAQALVGWLGAHASHRAWRGRAEAHAAVSVDDVNRLVRLMDVPGREVVGILEPELDPKSGQRSAGRSRRDGPPIDINPSGNEPQGQP